MLYCIFRLSYTTQSNVLLPRPLLQELDSIYSLSSLLFPCQDSLQYFQLLPALLGFYDVHVGLLSCTKTNPFETEMPKYVA